MTRYHLTIVTCLLLLVTTASAGWQEDSRTAFNDNNPERAVEIVKSAADRGDAEAEFFLGQLYARGQGVSQDIEKGIAWMTIGVEHGFKREEGSFRQIKERVSPAQLERAKSLADGLRASKGGRR